MIIKITIHSIVDIITNSSSEIFITTQYTAIEEAKKLIDMLLAEAGAAVKADDLFEFSIVNRGYDPECSDEDNADDADYYPNDLIIKSKKHKKIEVNLSDQIYKIFKTEEYPC